ncbi:hypothetical protein [Bradyrhizobium sp. B117]|uniref:hypothetical protein n=1 Tax=Bradyrhizobium sp. B117 TaxID=3140246 RepID=UPI003183083A
MESPLSTPEDQSGTAPANPAPPPWMHRARPYAPERRARMLEHMARARSLPQRQAAAAPELPGKSGQDLLHDLLGHIVLSGLLALIFMSRVPLYVGAFLFLTDGERIEGLLATLGIRLEPNTIGPDIIKGSASWFGWFALLAVLKGSAPAWLLPWMPSSESWSFFAGVALLLATIEACGALAMRRASQWFGWGSWPDSLTSATIKFVIVIAVLALLVLLGSL